MAGVVTRARQWFGLVWFGWSSDYSIRFGLVGAMTRGKWFGLVGAMTTGKWFGLVSVVSRSGVGVVVTRAWGLL